MHAPVGEREAPLTVNNPLKFPPVTKRLFALLSDPCVLFYILLGNIYSVIDIAFCIIPCYTNCNN